MLLVALAAACGSPPAAPSQPVVAAPVEATEPEVMREPATDAPFTGDIPAPATGFEISVPMQDGQVMQFAIAADGGIQQWVSPYARPTDPARVQMRADWSLWDQQNDRSYFALGEDGELSPTGYDPEMHCTAFRDGRAHCRCEAHTPVVDLTYAVENGDLVVSTSGRRTAIGTVTPAPTSAAEKLRVLVIIAEWTYSRDDHGDSAHDIDR
jgi:hypothetical protein